MSHLPLARFASFALLSALVVLLAVRAFALAQQSVTVPLDAINKSNVTGTVILTANGDATNAVLDLSGLTPNAQGTATNYGNTCERPSASFATVASFTADASGSVHATGIVLFHDENVPLASLVDGEHIIGIHSGRQFVACGVIPQ